MANYTKIGTLMMAMLLAFSATGCAASKEETTAQVEESSNEQLWVVDNSYDVQQDYVMENPSAIGDLTTPVMAQAQNNRRVLSSIKTKQEEEQSEVKAIWLSYLDLKPMLLTSGDQSVGKKKFTENIGKAFDNIEALGLNTVIAQVRPFGDALYESELFPWSYLAAGTEGKNPGFDPLEIMVEQAHDRGLRLEAWVNPYRVRSSAGSQEISKSNPVNKMLTSGDAIKYNGAISYNPASKKAQKLIVDGVREIVENYDVDGIHFDDYFYPTTDSAFDAKSYQAYKKAGGTMGLGAWRRENVNQLVNSVYDTIKEVNESVVFGISPQGNMDNNYNNQFIDVEKWLTKDGYIDYICPQIYFGFKNKTCPYEKTVEEWNDMIKNDVKLYVGLAPYKIGLEDKYAGDGGVWEWANNSDMLARMVETARDAENYQGFSLFRYDSVFHPQSNVKSRVAEEMDSLKELL